MNSRERWVTGVCLLREYLQDDLVLARMLRKRRWADLLAAAEIIHEDVDPNLAVTDPALYKALRDAVTKAHLCGYRCLDPHELRLKAGIDDIDDIEQPTS